MNDMQKAATAELEPVDATLLRLRKLELRQDASEQALRDVMAAVKKLPVEITGGIMRAFSGVFHSLSDRLLELSEIPSTPVAKSFDIKRLPDDAAPAIIVTRVGEQYNFSSTDTPDKIQNENTEFLARMFAEKQLLADGEAGRYSITYSSEAPHDAANESKPDVSES